MSSLIEINEIAHPVIYLLQPCRIKNLTIDQVLECRDLLVFCFEKLLDIQPEGTYGDDIFEEWVNYSDRIDIYIFKCTLRIENMEREDD